MKIVIPVHISRLPAQFGCCESFHTPASQNLPLFAGSALNCHFCRSATVSSSRPPAKAAKPSASVATEPSGGRAATATPAASVCGSETTQPHANEMNQKPKAPELVERMSVSRPSWRVCSAR